MKAHQRTSLRFFFFAEGLQSALDCESQAFACLKLFKMLAFVCFLCREMAVDVGFRKELIGENETDWCFNSSASNMVSCDWCDWSHSLLIHNRINC